MRHIYQSGAGDGRGNVIPQMTVSCFLADTTTAANVYAAETGGSPVNAVLTAEDGSFLFFVDDADYSLNQRFKITLTRNGYITKSYNDIAVFAPVPSNTYYPDCNAADQGGTANSWSVKSIINRVGSDNATIILRNNSGSINTSYTVATALTIPSNIELKLEIGGMFVKSGSGTLTINSAPVGNPMHQWLSGFAVGEVLFGSSSINEFPIIWVGGSNASSASVNATALAIAMNIAQSTPRIEIIVGKGIHEYNGSGLSITIPMAVKIRGTVGGSLTGISTAILERASILFYSGTGTALTVNGTGMGFEMSNLIFSGSSAANDGVFLNGTSAELFNVSFMGFTKTGAAGLHIRSCQVSNFYSCGFVGNYDGVYIEGQAYETTTMHFYSPVFHSNLRHGYYDTGSYRTVLTNITGQNNAGSTVFVDHTLGVDGSLLHINGGYFSQNNGSIAGYDIDIRGKAGTASAWMRFPKIENIHFGSRGASQLGEVRLRNTRQARLENFKFASATAPNIVAAALDNDALLLINIDNGLGDNMVQDGSGTTIYWPHILSGDNTLFLSIRGRLKVGQYNPASADEVLRLQQNDVTVGFIDYQGTSEAGVSKNITTWKVGAVLTGFTKTEINGISYWQPYYTAPTTAEPSANADTSLTFTGADTVAKADVVLLQTEVNELKATLRSFGLIAT